jgi:hypothetical protein
LIVELPEWQPFTAGRAPWMPESSERGRVVVALAPAATSRERWSADVALGIADAWGESGHRVVVADCVLEHPTLHRNAGLENGEGVVDAALFGASVSRVAQSVPGRSFFFVSAGSPAGDPEAVVTSARWGRLQDGFRDAGVTFVVFLREGCVGEAMIIDDADDIVVLTDSADRVPRTARETAGKIRMLVGLDGPARAAPDQGGEPISDDAAFLSDMDAASSSDADVDVDEAWGTPVDAEPSDPSGTGWDDPALAGLGDWDSADPESDEAGADAFEEAMDFTMTPTAEGEAGAEVPIGTTDDPGPVVAASHMHTPEAEPAGSAATVPPASRSGRRGGADPDARRKLLWVALAVLILVVLVVLGALRQG